MMYLKTMFSLQTFQKSTLVYFLSFQVLTESVDALDPEDTNHYPEDKFTQVMTVS